MELNKGKPKKWMISISRDKYEDKNMSNSKNVVPKTRLASNYGNEEFMNRPHISIRIINFL